MQQRLESREWERERERKIGICFQLKGQDIGVGTQEQQMLKKDKKWEKRLRSFVGPWAAGAKTTFNVASIYCICQHPHQKKKFVTSKRQGKS